MKIVPCDILNNSCNNYGDKSKNVEMNELNQIQTGQSGIFSIQNSNLKANSDDYSNQNEENEEILEHADLYEKENCFGVFVLKIRSFIVAKLTSPLAKRILIGALLILYPIYIGFAMKLNNPFNFPSNLNSSTIIDDYVFTNNRGLAFLVLNVIGFMFLFWDKVVKTLFKSNRFNLERFNTCNTNWINIPILKKLKSWIVVVLVSILCIAYLIYDMKELDNLISLAGLGCFILICIFLSEHPGRVNFYTLSVGILIQFILGVFILRSEFGYQLFKFLGAQVTTFLDYTDNGSRLVFGDSFKDHYFAFKVMPVVIFFSAVVNVLYHYGAVQYFLIKIAWLINFLMKTSPTESVNSVANIFVGCAEAPLLIKPFLPHMTESELFAVMVAAFSTVSGSVLAAYIGFGVPPDHLITAGLMSAPASLAIAKILFPETKKTNADWVAIRSVKIKKFNNVFEAISNGAIDMIKAVGAILANLIAFVSIFSLLDTACIWFFSMINLKNFGLASILQFIFWPFAFLMGVKIEDCLSVAKLVGLKVFVNEFVAYTHLGSVINFRNNATANGTLPLYKNGTLPIPDGISMIWNDKSIVIATYALCGFANFGTIGIEIAILSVFAPTRTKVFIKYAAKAMIAGNFSSFMNACIAGLLFKKI